MKLLLVRSSHVTENSPSSINRFVNGLKEEHETLFSRTFICVKKQDFYIKRQLSLKIYIFVKKQYFYNRLTCKKAAFFT